MGTVALRAYFDSGNPIIRAGLLGEMFALFPLGLEDTGVSDDIRIASRFHKDGIDIDLSSDHSFSSRDTSILTLASQLQALFKKEGLRCDLYILRAGDNFTVTPISTLHQST